MKLFLVVGTRPNFMKLAPLWRELRKHGEFEPYVVHTGQHYDYEMSQVFFEDLELPEPDFYLGVGSGTHAKQTADVMVRLEELFLNEKPDAVIVFGDVNSTLAAAIVTSKLLIPLHHVEAGVRSFDRTMPEEINRVVTDALSHMLFVPDDFAVKNLRNEGIDESKIFLVGNIMMDSLVTILDKIKSREESILKKYKLTPKEYGLVTLHRPSNVDLKDTFLKIYDILETIAKDIELVFPIHPRTGKNMKNWGVEFKHVRVVDPLKYSEFIALQKNALFVITDSGGVQTESSFLNVPCLTARSNTEWHITIEKGTNTLVNHDKELILNLISEIKHGNYKTSDPIPLWDGQTAERIGEVLFRESEAESESRKA